MRLARPSPSNSRACGTHPIACSVGTAHEHTKGFFNDQIQPIQEQSLLCAVTLLFAGCNKKDDSKINYQTAINDYYKAHPACIWQDTKKFPVQAATSDDAKTEGFDALTDTGLLTRTTAEKKVFIIASKQVNNYDLSDSRAFRLDAGYDPARIR